MGQPQSNNTAVFAVILVALILFLFIGGAVVVLGGMLFWVSTDMPAQQVVVSSEDYTTRSVDIDTGFAPPVDIATASPVILLDDAGQISLDGQVYSSEELRTHLEQQVEANPSDVVIPQLQTASNCPEEVRADVIAICEEVTGNTPHLVDSAVPSEPLPVESPVPAGETTEEGE